MKTDDPRVLDRCHNGCTLDRFAGWLPANGCPTHTPQVLAPVPCAECGFDLRANERPGVQFHEGATSHMRDFHNMGQAQALRAVAQSTRDNPA